MGRVGDKEKEQNSHSPNWRLNRECLKMIYQIEICSLNLLWLFLGKRKDDSKNNQAKWMKIQAVLL